MNGATHYLAHDFDLGRFVVLVLIAWNMGSTFAAMVRFYIRFRELDPADYYQRRLWVARLAIRVVTLALILFALDATLEHWGDPLRWRSLALALALVLGPWAHAELTRDVLRLEPGTRRSGDRTDA